MDCWNDSIFIVKLKFFISVFRVSGIIHPPEVLPIVDLCRVRMKNSKIRVEDYIANLKCAFVAEGNFMSV